MISIRYRALNEHFIGFLAISTVVIVFWRLYRTKTNEKRRKLLLPITKQPYLGIDRENSKLFPFGPWIEHKCSESEIFPQFTNFFCIFLYKNMEYQKMPHSDKLVMSLNWNLPNLGPWIEPRSIPMQVMIQYWISYHKRESNIQSKCCGS